MKVPLIDFLLEFQVDFILFSNLYFPYSTLDLNAHICLSFIYVDVTDSINLSLHKKY